MIFSGNDITTRRGAKGTDDEKFSFPEQGGGFRAIRSNNYDVIMKLSSTLTGASCKCSPVSGTPWKIILTKDHKVLISPKGSPGKFMYITKTDKIGVYQGDPGPQGYWMISMGYNGETIHPKDFLASASM